MTTAIDTSLGPCGCDLLAGRCADHSAKMRAIRAVWDDRDLPLLRRIWAASDGYGAPGFIPEQGYDWSGIRDSSVGAIDHMFLIAIGG